METTGDVATDRALALKARPTDMRSVRIHRCQREKNRETKGGGGTFTDIVWLQRKRKPKTRVETRRGATDELQL